jgi:hypothetical protein
MGVLGMKEIHHFLKRCYCPCPKKDKKLKTFAQNLPHGGIYEISGREGGERDLMPTNIQFVTSWLDAS